MIDTLLIVQLLHFSGMDPKTRRTLWDRLNQIRNKGKSLVLTTHGLVITYFEFNYFIFLLLLNYENKKEWMKQRHCALK